MNTDKKRIIIKIGSNLITENENILNDSVIEDLCNQISGIHDKGFEVIVVSSGAVAAGRQYLGVLNKQIKINQSYLIHKQVLASIGQPLLMKAYEKYFSNNSKGISQGLLSREDFENRSGYLNIRNTLTELLSVDIIPIINENDVVSTDELENKAYGDNDRLSAMVANAVDADVLILLGTIDALYTSDPNFDDNAKKIKIVDNISEDIISYAKGPADNVGSGGMTSKIQAANIAINSGIDMFIASGYEKNVILRIITGDDIGTKFVAKESLKESRKRWLITGYSSSKGEVILDDGAIKAIENSSLLPAGILEVSGNFDRGDIIGIKNLENKIIGWGIANYSSLEISKIKGMKTKDIINTVDKNFGTEIIHRNNLVITI
jgi:glutamate 5-kinase